MDERVAGDEAWSIGERPGFLIRRLHQIHVGLFMDLLAEFQITPLQYSVLSALETLDPVDQTAIAQTVFLDRTTTTGILKRLAARGLVERTAGPTDRRRQVSCITPAGRQFLRDVKAQVKRAHAETLKPLSPAEQTQIIELMGRVVAARQGEGEDRLLTI
jgi:MarR family transcriptional regulator, lower aerobic nicotinate degradation pathway regulator